MWKCENCGFEFEEPAIAYEDMGEFWGFPCTRQVEVCPSCKVSDFYENDFYDEEDENAAD